MHHILGNKLIELNLSSPKKGNKKAITFYITPTIEPNRKNATAANIFLSR